MSKLFYPVQANGSKSYFFVCVSAGRIPEVLHDSTFYGRTVSIFQSYDDDLTWACFMFLFPLTEDIMYKD